MNKFFHIVIIATLLVTSCINKDKKYSYRNFDLTCPVKSLKINAYEAEAKFGEVIKGEPDNYGLIPFSLDMPIHKNCLIEFNSDGQISKDTRFDILGEIESVCLYKYNDTYQLIEEEDYNSLGKLNAKYELFYEGSNLLKTTYWKASSRYSDETTGVFEYNYDNNITEIRYYSNGEFVQSSKSSKKDNFTAEIIDYSEDGEEISKRLIIRNNKGGIIKTVYNGDTTEYIRNNSNLITKIIDDSDVIYIDYEYDTKDNWIKCIIYEGEVKIPLEIVERTITY